MAHGGISLSRASVKNEVHFTPNRFVLNPFTATGCKISGLKSAGTSLQNSTFSGPIATLFSVVCVLTEILSCQCEKANKQT